MTSTCRDVEGVWDLQFDVIFHTEVEQVEEEGERLEGREEDKEEVTTWERAASAAAAAAAGDNGGGGGAWWLCGQWGAESCFTGADTHTTTAARTSYACSYLRCVPLTSWTRDSRAVNSSWVHATRGSPLVMWGRRGLRSAFHAQVVNSWLPSRDHQFIGMQHYLHTHDHWCPYVT